MAVKIDLKKSGYLGKILSEELKDLFLWTDGSNDPPDCLLAIYDLYAMETEREFMQLANQMGIPYLGVRRVFDQIVVGPLVRLDQAGCMVCCEMRQHLHVHHEIASDMKNFSQKQSTVKHVLLPLITKTTARLLMKELQRLAEENEADLHRKIIMVDIANGEVTYSRFLPVETCPICGGTVATNAEPYQLVSRKKIGFDQYRTRHIQLEDLKQAFCDPKTGIVSTLASDYRKPLLAVSGAFMPVPFGNKFTEGVGRSTNFISSQITAVLEAVERYAGLAFFRGVERVCASYTQIKDDAIHPPSLILHSPEQYMQEGFLFQQYSDDQMYNWVWGTDLTRDQALLIPEQFVYYGPQLNSARFCYETSNGCAIGSNLEEATLYGLFETIERDSFLITWYGQAKHGIHEIIMPSHGFVGDMVAKMASMGYELHAFDVTTEIGIPSIWLIAVRIKGEGHHALCTAACHLDPKKALHSAVEELMSMISWHGDEYEKKRASALNMLEDSSLVKSMEDHSLLYSLPEAFPRLEFLWNCSTGKVYVEEMKPKWFTPTDDIKEDLMQIIHRLKKQNLRLIVADQTSIELREQGLVAARVLVPGTLPMTFGHQFRRLEGCERLGTPATLLPHPFP